MLRRLVAWLGHAPGLWLVYGETLAPKLRRANVVAAGATLLGIGGAVCLVDNAGWGTIVIPWAIGHVLWGTYLAWLLPMRRDS